MLCKFVILLILGFGKSVFVQHTSSSEIPMLIGGEWVHAHDTLVTAYRKMYRVDFECSALHGMTNF